MSKRVIRIGTRESALAMWQTEFAVSVLKGQTGDYDFEIVPIKTKGDKILDVALSKIGDKALFTKELEQAMLDGQIDLAVHSMKDMPTAIVEGLTIGAILKRHDPHDALIATEGFHSLDDLPQGAKVGTSSLRRRAQILHVRPDLNLYDVRGNLHTRMRKMTEEGFDALILAVAGVERLGWSERITEKLSYDVCLPAVSQGAIGLECRQDDAEMLALAALVGDQETTECVQAERAFLETLEGGCQAPIGALAIREGEQIFLQGIVGSLDGKILLRDQLVGSRENPEKIGQALAKRLWAGGAGQIIESIRQELGQ